MAKKLILKYILAKDELGNGYVRQFNYTLSAILE